MAEYIEREAARNALYDADAVTFKGLIIINQFPAADVAPVRHGKWKDEADYDGDSMYVCSECGETWTLIDGTPIDNNMYYCPHCGARMDGEDHG